MSFFSWRRGLTADMHHFHIELTKRERDLVKRKANTQIHKNKDKEKEFVKRNTKYEKKYEMQKEIRREIRKEIQREIQKEIRRERALVKRKTAENLPSPWWSVVSVSRQLKICLCWGSLCSLLTAVAFWRKLLKKTSGRLPSYICMHWNTTHIRAPLQAQMHSDTDLCFWQAVSKLSQSCFKVVLKLSQSCPKVVSKQTYVAHPDLARFYGGVHRWINKEE